jgi:putative redox protein
MKLTATYHGGTRYDITNGNHRIVTDQPAVDGGQDAGMSPVELFVGSVAGCVAYFVGQFCARHNISREGLRVDADWAMAEQPHRVGRINLAVHLPHRITAEQRDRLLKVAHGCTVHQSIAVTSDIAITLNPHSHEKPDRPRGAKGEVTYKAS